MAVGKARRNSLPAPRRATVAIDSIIPNPRADNTHSEEQIGRLLQSYARFGQTRPILVREANQMIVAGHAVHAAMVKNGATHIDVLLWDVDQGTADAYLVADNRFSELSRPDHDRRRALLADVDPEDYAAIGFDLAEIEALMNEGDTPAVVYEVETSTVSDDFWISVKGPLTQQAAALKRLTEVMGEFPGLTVELGTVIGP